MTDSMFLVRGGMGNWMVRAASAGRAETAARHEFGNRSGPYKALRADAAAMRQHLEAGAMFFELDGSVIPKAEAFAMCGYRKAPTHFNAGPSAAGGKGGQE